MTNEVSPGGGRRPAAVSLPSTSGEMISVPAADAAATVVVFTCNHCPYALAWHDRINDVGRDFADQSVVLIQINSNDAARYPADSVDRMRERVSSDGFAGPYLVDQDQSVARRWGARVTPDVFVVDGTGAIRYHGAPDADHDRPDLGAEWLRAALDDVLAGRPVARPSTQPRGCSIKWVERADA